MEAQQVRNFEPEDTPEKWEDKVWKENIQIYQDGVKGAPEGGKNEKRREKAKEKKIRNGGRFFSKHPVQIDCVIPCTGYLYCYFGGSFLSEGVFGGDEKLYELCGTDDGDDGGLSDAGSGYGSEYI